MANEDTQAEVVDPEVRAYVYSLVSALGGTGSDENGRYVLGDDAFACLKDLKKWLKFYDEKANRLDVARCLAEANLVKGDLLEILAAWPNEAGVDKMKSKIALACLELLVPLTWPIEKDELQMTVNHHRHIPYLQLAQISYKRGILEHDSSSILRTAVRVGLPSIALPMGERTSRDEGIIKLLLYFLRNIAIISAPLHLPIEFDENEVSRSATIEAFHQQDVLALLLTVASNMGEDFRTQDVVVMEILFHILKGIDIEKLFMDETQLDGKKADELQYLLKKEAGMHRDYARNAPTRHNRFGTMIWVKRDDARVSTVSGQDVLANDQHTLSKMDQSKKWNRPKQRGKNTERTHNHFDLPVPLSVSAAQHLRNFVQEFLDSGFNPLFSHVRRSIEREADRVLEVHSRQFFYLVSWFLEAERVRRRTKKEMDQRSGQNLEQIFEPDSFGLVASVLNQETFITLNRFMHKQLDIESWQEVNAGMRCFTQILLTVQEMSESSLEEDQEIAENIQNRIFYEETTHDRIIAILRGYKDQGFSYLDACTELSHVFLRLLERYSKKNIDLQVRSRRRARKKKNLNPESDAGFQGPEPDSEAEDMAEAHRVSKERKFDFTRFSSKFLTQNCVNTFVTFTSYFKDFTAEQLKRAHRFFYRVAFKQEMSVVLFRLDIIALFNRIIKGPEGLDTASIMFKEWDELTRQLIRRMFKKLQQRPELAVEMLFSKINSTVFYLEYGYERQKVSSKPRPPAELEVRGAMTREEQLGVAVAVLHDTKLDAIDWVKDLLTFAVNERRSWEVESSARSLPETAENEHSNEATLESRPKPASIIVRPDSEERRIAMFKDNKLRLLMTLAGFERIGIDDEPDATWVIPSSLTSEMLQKTFDLIEGYRNNPVMQYGDEDPLSAEEMLRRKSAKYTRRAEFDDDSSREGVESDDEEEFLFPAGGPTNRKPDALAELKKKRRKRRVEGSDDESRLDEASLEARRKARRLAELEKRRKIKSEEFVIDSDGDEDEERDREFFAREESLRKGHAKEVLKAIRTARLKFEETNIMPQKVKKRKVEKIEAASGKRRKLSDTGTESEQDEARPVSAGFSSSTHAQGSDTSDDEMSDTPPSSPHLNSSQEKSLKQNPNNHSFDKDTVGHQVSALVLNDDGDEEGPVMTNRRRARVAIVSDTDSD